MIKNVRKLIVTGKGDTQRLREILDNLKQGLPMPLSDFKYVQDLIKPPEEEVPQANQSKKRKFFVKKEEKKNNGPTSTRDSALSILKNRLASGEITIDQFNALKKALKEM